LGVPVGGRHLQWSEGRGAEALCAGDHQGERPGREAVPGHRGWGAGIDPELAGGVAGPEAARPGRAPETGGGGRRPGLLVGVGGSVPRDAPPALLGTQDGERAELPAQGRPTEGEAGPAGDLDGRGPGLGAQGVRRISPNVRSQIPEGRRLPGEGPGGVADLLRLPGGALGAHSNDEPGGIDLCDDSPPDGPGQGLREPEHDAGDDLQAGDERREALAQDPGIHPPSQGHRRREIQRRHRSGHRNRQHQERRLMNPSYTRFDYSSKNVPNWSISSQRSGSTQVHPLFAARKSHQPGHYQRLVKE